MYVKIDATGRKEEKRRRVCRRKISGVEDERERGRENSCWAEKMKELPIKTYWNQFLNNFEIYYYWYGAQRASEQKSHSRDMAVSKAIAKAAIIKIKLLSEKHT